VALAFKKIQLTAVSTPEHSQLFKQGPENDKNYLISWEGVFL